MTRRSASRASVIAIVAVVASVAVIQGCREVRARGLGQLTLGAETRLGDGTVSSYARIDRDRSPVAIGVLFSATALEGLPTEPTDRHRCHDHDGDGTIVDAECLPTHERVIPLPTEVSRRADIPFKWVLLNWNPAGHAPHEVYGLPHFDIHFYIDPIEKTFALMPGPCGPEFIRCDQFARATRPVPAKYMHADFQNVDAAAPAMGNHLIDMTSPELHGTVFDRTWIFGTYDGRVTFWEEMVTLDFLRGRPDVCYDIKTPPAVEVAGYYPTRSCFRVDATTNEVSVSIEGFEYRDASPPASAQEASPPVNADEASTSVTTG